LKRQSNLIRDRDGAVGDVMAVPVPGGLHHHYVGQLSRESPENRTRVAERSGFEVSGPLVSAKTADFLYRADQVLRSGGVTDPLPPFRFARAAAMRRDTARGV